jgi:iron complex outermembrane recepter protein
MVRTIVAWVLAAVLLTTTAVQAQGVGSVAGVVRAEATERPISGALVVVVDVGETTTGPDGRFVIARVPPGTHSVVVSRAGFTTLTESLTTVAGQEAALDVRLPPQTAVSESVSVVGRVSDYVQASADASRTSARLLDVPQAIAVLPARLLQDIGALDTKELYKYVSGVTDSPYSSTVMRGFTQREVLVNGARGNPYGSLDGDVNNTGFSTSQFRLTNVERVEVLKGPSAVLYGSSEPGGVFNYITKKPRDMFGAQASLGTGSFGQALGEAEVTGPIDAGKKWLYRGAVYFEDRDTFRNNTSTRNAHAVGGLTWRPTPRSTLAVEYEHIDQRNEGHRLRGIPVTANGTFLTDYRWTATEPGDFTDLVADTFQVRGEHAWRSGARLESTMRLLAYDRTENYHEPRGITNGGTLMQREFRDQFRSNDDWSGFVNLSLPVRTGAVVHDIATGIDTLRQDHQFRFATARQQSSGGPVPPLSLASPTYGATSPAAYGLTASSYTTDLAVSVRRGAYAQDLMSLGTRWHLLVGGRVDTYDDEGRSSGVALAADQTAATGRVGVVFKPVSFVSLYGTVSNGFTRPAILTQAPSANGPHEPETARQGEVGIKTEWLDGRVQLTGAWFQVQKKNVLRPDPLFGPNGNNVNAVLSTGEIRNRGLEIDLAGQLLPRWNLAANYAYLDSEITRDPVASLIGKAMPNAAPHKVGLFTRIDLPRGAGIGGSLEYVGDRVEPFANIAAPAYTVVDGQLFQQLTARVRLLVKLENVFDTRYAASSLFAARAGNIPGQPRTLSVLMTVTSATVPAGARLR